MSTPSPLEGEGWGEGEAGNARQVAYSHHPRHTSTTSATFTRASESA